MELPNNSAKHDEEAFEAPPRLISAVRKLSQQKVFVPSTVDETVLRAARQQLRPAHTRRFALWRFAPWLAGAGVAVALILLSLEPARRSPDALPAMITRQDVNQDGAVDILDAFALARQLESGAPVEHAKDLNNDGRVDQQDVAVLAAMAVRLEKGGPS